MDTNPNDRIALNPVVAREDRTLIAIATIAVSVSIVVVVVAFIVYCWHFDIAIDFNTIFNRILDILDRRG
jgi:hypothetical protein